ncbi:MAG TPA: MlaD family protein [Aeromicrobium sp.]|nr:MlaD family protein [Aeromicrobium sp.]
MARRILDAESFSSMIKLLIFLFFTGACTFLLMLILGNGSFGSRSEYKAVFADATGVAKGDDVRIAGVPVGAVDKVEVYDTNKALVTFSVDQDVDLKQNTLATLKFRNLVGQRYLALSQDDSLGPNTVIKPGTILDEDHTQEALDLNVLLNGFKPVFQALSPDDVNQFSFEIVQTLQGESGSVEQLLARTSSLTNTLADRDQLIGDTITNLSSVLDMVGSRDAELSDTIDTLQRFVTGLKDDKDAILDSIDSISALSVETSDLLRKGRPALSDDVTELNALTKGLSKESNLKQMDESIKIFQHKLTKYGNAASSGAEFNFYLCKLAGSVTIPGLPQIDLANIQVGGTRCSQ